MSTIDITITLPFCHFQKKFNIFSLLFSRRMTFFDMAKLCKVLICKDLERPRHIVKVNQIFRYITKIINSQYILIPNNCLLPSFFFRKNFWPPNLFKALFLRLLKTKTKKTENKCIMYFKTICILHRQPFNICGLKKSYILKQTND